MAYVNLHRNRAAAAVAPVPVVSVPVVSVPVVSVPVVSRAPAHGAAMSMRSPQGSRFQLSGGSPQLHQSTSNGGAVAG